MGDEDVKASEVESCLNEEVKNELCDNVAKELHTFAEARDEYASVDLRDEGRDSSDTRMGNVLSQYVSNVPSLSSTPLASTSEKPASGIDAGFN